MRPNGTVCARLVLAIGAAILGCGGSPTTPSAVGRVEVRVDSSVYHIQKAGYYQLDIGVTLRNPSTTAVYVSRLCTTAARPDVIITRPPGESATFLLTPGFCVSPNPLPYANRITLAPGDSIKTSYYFYCPTPPASTSVDQVTGNFVLQFDVRSTPEVDDPRSSTGLLPLEQRRTAAFTIVYP